MFSTDGIPPWITLARMSLSQTVGGIRCGGLRGACRLGESEAKPQPAQPIGILAELRFTAAGFLNQPVALRYRQGMLLQVLQRQGRGGLSNRNRKPLHQPIFQNADTTDAALVEVFPKPHQVRRFKRKEDGRIMPGLN